MAFHIACSVVTVIKARKAPSTSRSESPSFLIVLVADFERSPLELHVFPSREFSLSCKSESRAGPEYLVYLRAGIFAMVLPVFSGSILHGCPWLRRVQL